MTIWGYARVSTRKSKGRRQQHVDNQVERLMALGIPKECIYVDDGVSGRKGSRPEWDKLYVAMKPGDKLIAVSLTRVGRSLQNLLDIMADFERRGIDVEFLEQKIATDSASGRLIFRIWASIAEYEAEVLAERVRDGLESAKERNGGKLPTHGPEHAPPSRRHHCDSGRGR
jgi:DNA invertase Pin-like site-specific DNA recombinase